MKATAPCILKRVCNLSHFPQYQHTAVLLVPASSPAESTLAFSIFESSQLSEEYFNIIICQCFTRPAKKNSPSLCKLLLGSGGFCITFG